MASLPANIGYGRVRGRFIQAVLDGPVDIDAYPDALPAQGTVTFTATPALLADDQPDPTLIVPRPHVVPIDAEGLIDVWLIANNDPDIEPGGWTWEVTFQIIDADLPMLVINVAEGSDQWLNEYFPPVLDPSSGELTARGPRGYSSYDEWLNDGNTGTFDDFMAQYVEVEIPARIGESTAFVDDWNSAVTNGWYRDDPNALNAPVDDVYCLGEVVNFDGWVYQTVWVLGNSASGNTNMYRRVRNAGDGTWGAWYRLRISQEELDDRYFQHTEVVADTNLPERLRALGGSFDDWDDVPGEAGYYSTFNAANTPNGAAGWTYGQVVGVFNAANYIVMARNREEGDALYYRRKRDNVWDPWIRVMQNLEESDARYMNVGEGLADDQLPLRLQSDFGGQNPGDYNEIRVSGWYVPLDTALNKPPGAPIAYSMLHVIGDGINCVQRVMFWTNSSLTDSVTWERTYRGGVWTNWERVRSYQGELDARYLGPYLEGASLVQSDMNLMSDPNDIASLPPGWVNQSTHDAIAFGDNSIGYRGAGPRQMVLKSTAAGTAVASSDMFPVIPNARYRVSADLWREQDASSVAIRLVWCDANRDVISATSPWAEWSADNIGGGGVNGSGAPYRAVSAEQIPPVGAHYAYMQMFNQTNGATNAFLVVANPRCDRVSGAEVPDRLGPSTPQITDANTATQTGRYWIAGSGSGGALNTPTDPGDAWGYLDVITYGGLSAYIHQRWIPWEDSFNGSQWERRFRAHTGWTDWKRVRQTQADQAEYHGRFGYAYQNPVSNPDLAVAPGVYNWEGGNPTSPNKYFALAADDGAELVVTSYDNEWVKQEARVYTTDQKWVRFRNGGVDIWGEWVLVPNKNMDFARSRMAAKGGSGRNLVFNGRFDFVSHYGQQVYRTLGQLPYCVPGWRGPYSSADGGDFGEWTLGGSSADGGQSLGLRAFNNSVGMYVHSDPFPVNPGKTYRWKFRVWSDAAIPNGIFMSLSMKKRAKEYSAFADDLVLDVHLVNDAGHAGGAFQTYEGYYTIPEGNAQVACLRPHAWTGSNPNGVNVIYYTDIEFEEVIPTAALGDTGWRRILSAGGISDMPNLAAAVRRVGNQVTVVTSEPTAGGTRSGFAILGYLPLGFRYLGAVSGLGEAFHFGGIVCEAGGRPIPNSSIYVDAGSGGQVVLMPVSGQRHYAHLTFTTADPFPAPANWPGVSA